MNVLYQQRKNTTICCGIYFGARRFIAALPLPGMNSRAFFALPAFKSGDKSPHSKAREKQRAHFQNKPHLAKKYKE